MRRHPENAREGRELQSLPRRDVRLGRGVGARDPSGDWSPLPAAHGHNRLHALAESILLDRALDLLGEVCSLPPPRPVTYAARSDLAPMEAAQSRLEQAAPEILALCIKAGFPEPEIVAALVLTLLQRTAAQLHGFLREAGGHKAWARELQPVVLAARDLAARLGGPSGTAIRAALPPQLEEVLPDFLQTPASHHAGRSLGELLPGLLNRFADGLEAQLAAATTRPGRPRQPEALVFGAEGLLGLWLDFHPLPPSMRDKVDGFVGWAAALLRLAVKANDAGGAMGKAGSDMLGRTTLTLVLNRVVAAHQRQGRPPHPRPQRLHPAWKQGRARDEGEWSDLSRIARQIERSEPSFGNGTRTIAAPPRCNLRSSRVTRGKGTRQKSLSR